MPPDFARRSVLAVLILLPILVGVTCLVWFTTLSRNARDLEAQLLSYEAASDQQGWVMPPRGNVESCDAALRLQATETRSQLDLSITSIMDGTAPPLGPGVIAELRSASHCRTARAGFPQTLDDASLLIALMAQSTSDDECLDVGVDAARLASAVCSRNPTPTAVWSLHFALSHVVECAGSRPPEELAVARESLYDLIESAPPVAWTADQVAIAVGYGALSRHESVLENSLDLSARSHILDLYGEARACERSYEEASTLANDLRGCSNPADCLPPIWHTLSTWPTCDADPRLMFGAYCEWTAVLRASVLALDLLAHHARSADWSADSLANDPLLRNPETGAPFSLDTRSGALLSWDIQTAPPDLSHPVPRALRVTRAPAP